MSSKFVRFIKAYFALRHQPDPEKAALALGKPDKLELTQEQAELVQGLFCGSTAEPGQTPASVARNFFQAWPRPSFRYFMALAPDHKSLEYTNGDPALDGVELINAAMIKLGAIKLHEDDGCWYYQTAHPMVKALADIGANQGDIASMTAKKRLLA